MKTTSTCLVSRAWAPWLKTLAYLLSVLLILYAVPANVYAELIETVESALDNESVEATDTSSETKKAVFEITDLREETVKHFRTEDGSFAAVQYNYPVHEKDANGVWQDIDNTLSESGSEYATPNARVKFAKKTTGNETLFTLHDGNRKITMSLSGANKKVAGQVTNTQTQFAADATQLQKLMTLDKLSSKILYPEILDGVDLEYVVNSCNIKENIIVKERANAYSYTFDIKLNNLEATLREDGSVAISDPNTDEVVYTIPEGYMFDADGEYSDAVEYSLSSSGNGSYALTVTADSTWINAAERAFPVTIDPPINASSDAGMTDTYIDSANSITTYYADSELKVGRTASAITKVSFWTLNDMPTLPANAYVVFAELSLRCTSISASSSSKIGAYTVSTDWTSNNAYSWASADISTICATDQLIDYANVSSSSSGNLITWNITSEFRAWYAADNASYGIALAPLTSSAVDVVFASANSTTATLPQLVVEYRDMKGMESYWSGSSHSAGLAGGGYVNHANGNLVFALNLIGTGDALFGYTPALVYNSSVADQYNINSYNPHVPYKRPSSAPGWKLSTDDSLVFKTYYDETGLLNGLFVWIDGDGTEHYFLSDGTSSDFKDEDGLGLTLAYDSAEQKYRITDLNHTIYRYSNNPETSELGLGNILESIQDQYGNKLIFHNNTQGHPTSIDLLPSGHDEDDAIQYLSLTYNSLGTLNKIQNVVTGQVMTMEFGTSFTNSSFISPTATGPLYRVTYGHMSGSTVVTDAVMAYSYTNMIGDQAGTIYRLASAKDENGGTEIKYTYDAVGRVETVTEYAGTVQGQSIRYMYGTDYTEVRNSGSDDILQAGSNSDDIITHYSLDYQGRAVSAYSTNAARTAMYGATNGSYEDPKSEDSATDNEKAKNSLKSSATIGSVTTNHIYNGGFEYGDDSANDSVYGWVKSSADIGFDYDRYLNCNRLLRIPVVPEDTEYVYQDVILPRGTYTLSSDCFTNIQGAQITIRASVGETVLGEDSFTLYKHLDASTGLSPTLTFTTSSTQTVRITLEVTGTSDGTGFVHIDNVMLGNNIGASSFNAVQFGGFRDTYADSNTSAAPTSYWSANNTSALTSSNAGLQGYGLKIAGDVNEDQWVRQRIYVTSSLLLEFATDPSIGNTLLKSRAFTVSGFGKANAQIANEDARFALKVDIYYYGSTSPETHYVDFNKELTDWQFVSKTFSVEEGDIVQYIDVSCTYAYQPNEAYFDNISLVEEKGSSAANYSYNSNGLVEFTYTPSDCVFYQYDDANNLIYVFDSQGNGRYLQYSEKILQSETTFKFDTNNLALQQWYFTTSGANGSLPVNLDDCTVISKTVYNINTYGLNTSTVSYAATGSVTSATQKTNSPRLSSSTVYNLTAGSPLFGRALSTTDTAGNTITYGYDSQGRRIYEANESYEGLYYNYDALGRLTGVTPLAYSPSVNTYFSQLGAENAQYTYDPQTHRLTQVTAGSTTYTFSYDEFGNNTQITAGGNILAQYQYNDNNGKLYQMRYGTGNVITYTYDELDRIQEVSYNTASGTESYKYTYTTTGAIHSVEATESGRLYLYKYDSKGQLIGYVECAKDDEGNYQAQLQHQYAYDDLNRIDFWLGEVEHVASDGQKQLYFVAQYYYYEDYASGTDMNGVTNVGELYQLDIWGAGTSSNAVITYGYDPLYRLSSKEMAINENWSITAEYTYRGTNNVTSSLVSNYTSTVTVGSVDTETSYSYSYDVNGNITQIVDGNGKKTSYKYDNLGQLIRENIESQNKTYVYTYDNAGNRISKKTYAYTTSNSLNSLDYTEISYSYDDTWGDQLISADGVAITYDEIGNPETFNGYALTWHGRQLKGMEKTNSEIKFLYNADGIRTSKTVNNVEHIYTLNGTQIVSESWGIHLLIYLYDESGSPIGMQYRNTGYAANTFDTFYFEKNLQGDVVAIYSENGVKVLSYIYDAWGNHTTTWHNGAGTNLNAVYNPFRYRGYYYDVETGLYYLQSRYYNPQWGRFLNADGYVNANGDLVGFNMYAYCSNNPVMFSDPSGEGFLEWLKKLFGFDDSEPERGSQFTDDCYIPPATMDTYYDFDVFQRHEEYDLVEYETFSYYMSESRATSIEQNVEKGIRVREVSQAMYRAVTSLVPISGKFGTAFHYAKMFLSLKKLENAVLDDYSYSIPQDYYTVVVALYKSRRDGQYCIVRRIDCGDSVFCPWEKIPYSKGTTLKDYAYFDSLGIPQ